MPLRNVQMIMTLILLWLAGAAMSTVMVVAATTPEPQCPDHRYCFTPTQEV